MEGYRRAQHSAFLSALAHEEIFERDDYVWRVRVNPSTGRVWLTLHLPYDRDSRLQTFVASRWEIRSI